MKSEIQQIGYGYEPSSIGLQFTQYSQQGCSTLGRVNFESTYVSRIT